eukprot:233360_1
MQTVFLSFYCVILHTYGLESNFTFSVFGDMRFAGTLPSNRTFNRNSILSSNPVLQSNMSMMNESDITNRSLLCPIISETNEIYSLFFYGDNCIDCNLKLLKFDQNLTLKYEVNIDQSNDTIYPLYPIYHKYKNISYIIISYFKYQSSETKLSIITGLDTTKPTAFDLAVYCIWNSAEYCSFQPIVYNNYVIYKFLQNGTFPIYTYNVSIFNLNANNTVKSSFTFTGLKASTSDYTGYNKPIISNQELLIIPTYTYNPLNNKYYSKFQAYDLHNTSNVIWNSSIIQADARPVPVLDYEYNVVYMFWYNNTVSTYIKLLQHLSALNATNGSQMNLTDLNGWNIGGIGRKLAFQNNKLFVTVRSFTQESLYFLTVFDIHYSDMLHNGIKITVVNNITLDYLNDFRFIDENGTTMIPYYLKSSSYDKCKDGYADYRFFSDDLVLKYERQSNCVPWQFFGRQFGYEKNYPLVGNNNMTYFVINNAIYAYSNNAGNKSRNVTIIVIILSVFGAVLLIVLVIIIWRYCRMSPADNSSSALKGLLNK